MKFFSEIRMFSFPKAAETACGEDLPSCVAARTCDNACIFLKTNTRINDDKAHFYWLVESARAPGLPPVQSIDNFKKTS